MFSTIFQKFVKEAPICVMARAAMERFFHPRQLDQWFNANARTQYTRELLFSSVFELMSMVVCGSRPSVNAAYQSARESIGVSITSLYNKLNGIEPHISAELVRHTAKQMIPLIQELGLQSDSELPGYRIKLLDGNCIEKSQHRIKELRTTSAGPLPGKSLVVYDLALGLPVDVFPCEDGHAQERALLPEVLPRVAPMDVWIADRNFCTVGFTCGIASKGAFFIIREHANYPCHLSGEEQYAGDMEDGRVYEQFISVKDACGQPHRFRRVRLALKTPTRDGDTEIFLITNLPQSDAHAAVIARLYRKRWTIETAFQELTEHLNSEINSLGYPRAALFGFCVALIAYMVHKVVKAALSSVHGAEVIEERVSGYYLSDEISGTWRGMWIATDEAEWAVFAAMTLSEFAEFLKMIAFQVNLLRYRKHKRGPKKPSPKRTVVKNKPHVSTARILEQRK